MAEASRNVQLEKLRTEIHISLVVSKCTYINAYQVNALFKDNFTKGNIPYADYGTMNLVEFLTTQMGGKLQSVLRNGEHLFKPAFLDDTKHMHLLVNETKQKKKKKRGGSTSVYRSLDVSSRPPVPRTASMSTFRPVYRSRGFQMPTRTRPPVPRTASMSTFRPVYRSRGSQMPTRTVRNGPITQRDMQVPSTSISTLRSGIPDPSQPSGRFPTNESNEPHRALSTSSASSSLSLSMSVKSCLLVRTHPSLSKISHRTPTMGKLCLQLLQLITERHPGGISVCTITEEYKRLFGHQLDPIQAYGLSWQQLIETDLKEKLSVDRKGIVRLVEKKLSQLAVTPPTAIAPTVGVPPSAITPTVGAPPSAITPTVGAPPSAITPTVGVPPSAITPTVGAPPSAITPTVGAPPSAITPTVEAPPSASLLVPPSDTSSQDPAISTRAIVHPTSSNAHVIQKPVRPGTATPPTMTIFTPPPSPASTSTLLDRLRTLYTRLMALPDNQDFPLSQVVDILGCNKIETLRIISKDYNDHFQLCFVDGSCKIRTKPSCPIANPPHCPIVSSSLDFVLPHQSIGFDLNSLELNSQERFLLVEISNYRDPTCFSLIMKDHINALSEMQQQLRRFYSSLSLEESRLPVEELVVGRICAVEFHGPKVGDFHRAIIEEFEENTNKARMFYVDYGNRQTVPTDLIRQLDSRFLKMPAQAINVSFRNVIPVDGAQHWSSQLEHRIQSLCRGHLWAYFISHDCENGKYYVELCDKEDDSDDDVWITATLKKERLLDVVEEEEEEEEDLYTPRRHDNFLDQLSQLDENEQETSSVLDDLHHQIRSLDLKRHSKHEMTETTVVGSR